MKVESEGCQVVRGLSIPSHHLVPSALSIQEVEDASIFDLFRGLETGSKFENFPLNNICQFVWDAEKGGVTGI